MSQVQPRPSGGGHAGTRTTHVINMFSRAQQRSKAWRWAKGRGRAKRRAPHRRRPTASYQQEQVKTMPLFQLPLLPLSVTQRLLEKYHNKATVMDCSLFWQSQLLYLFRQSHRWYNTPCIVTHQLQFYFVNYFHFFCCNDTFFYSEGERSTHIIDSSLSKSRTCVRPSFRVFVL